MSTQTNTGSGGIGFAGLLTILFVALKLTGHITWTWLWVLSPIWISFGIELAAVAVLFVCASVLWTGQTIAGLFRRKRLF